MFSNKQISEFFYKPCRDEHDELVVGCYRCHCGVVRQQAPRTGYTNLVQHVVSQHPDHQATMQAASPGETGTLASWVRQRSINLFGWMEWIVKNNLPLNFCESEEARRYTKLDPICVQTLCRFLHKVTRAVEAKLAAEMPDQFGLIIDGWTHASEHYLAVFGCYMVGSTPSYPLLAMAPLLNEPGDDHSAETHRVFLQEMLRRDYGKDIGKCAFIVGDNCSVNRRLAGLLHVLLVGCASHRLNLAMEKLLEESSQDLGSVQALMIKLRSLNQAAKLRLNTSLRPVIGQETRWSSTFMILDRYFKLLEFVKDDLEDALPTRAENRRLKSLHAELTNVESGTKALQSTKVSMADARLFVDRLITLRASFAKYLGERAEIVYAADFEAACLKIQEGRAHQLSRAQKAAVSQLAVREAPATGAASDGAQAAALRRKTTGSSGDEEESFVERLKSARKAVRGKTSYPLMAAIPPTSNIVERLFSVARLTLGLERSRSRSRRFFFFA